jgi:endonuclease V-like protein UPF0215 family
MKGSNMATQPKDNFDHEEQRVRIIRSIEEAEKFAAETRRIVADMIKVQAETKVLPWITIFQAMLATAALLGAGAAIAKLFFP